MFVVDRSGGVQGFAVSGTPLKLQPCDLFGQVHVQMGFYRKSCCHTLPVESAPFRVSLRHSNRRCPEASQLTNCVLLLPRPCDHDTTSPYVHYAPYLRLRSSDVPLLLLLQTPEGRLPRNPPTSSPFLPPRCPIRIPQLSYHELIGQSMVAGTNKRPRSQFQPLRPPRHVSYVSSTYFPASHAAQIPWLPPGQQCWTTLVKSLCHIKLLRAYAVVVRHASLHFIVELTDYWYDLRQHSEASEKPATGGRSRWNRLPSVQVDGAQELCQARFPSKF